VAETPPPGRRPSCPFRIAGDTARVAQIPEANRLVLARPVASRQPSGENAHGVSPRPPPPSWGSEDSAEVRDAQRYPKGVIDLVQYMAAQIAIEYR